ncbi:MAG: PDZ domain-containing protein [Bacteroidia bacterium]
MKTTKNTLALALALLFAVSTFTSTTASAIISEKSELSLKSVSNAELGMEYTMSTTSPIGISVTKVYNEGIAKLMGIEENDQILGLGSNPVMGNFDALLKEQKPGALVAIRVLRRKEQMVINTTMPALYNTTNAKAFLGVETSSKTKAGQMGIKVQNVLDASAAEFAGIRKGDIILGLGNKPVFSGNLSDLLNEQKAGTVILVRIKRGNEVLNQKVILGSHGELNENVQPESKGGVYSKL